MKSISKVREGLKIKRKAAAKELKCKTGRTGKRVRKQKSASKSFIDAAAK